MSRQLAVLGLNHRSAPVEVRERLALTEGRMDGLLESLLSLDAVQEVVLLSTCNRVEVVACSDRAITEIPEVVEHLAGDTGLSAEDCQPYLYNFADREAVRHLFRVAASLDSMVVGEPQILGQMKDQFEQSVDAHTAGPVLHRVFHKAFSVAKRVRSETGIASRTVSVASTAVDLASHIFEGLEGRMVLLIGAGDMGETAARHFQGAGVTDIMVANRTFETGVTLARELGGTPIPLERLHNYLPLADLVVGSAGGGELLSAKEVKALMRERRGKAVFFIDLAVPRNFAPAINKLDGAYLYDMDDLSSVVEENIEERQREAVRGEAIVEGEVDSFAQWFEKLAVIPTIVALREYAEEVRSEELAKTVAKLNGMNEEDRLRIDHMSRAIVNKLLHRPTNVLKRESSAEEEARMLSTVRRLFSLEDEL